MTDSPTAQTRLPVAYSPIADTPIAEAPPPVTPAAEGEPEERDRRRRKALLLLFLFGLLLVLLIFAIWYLLYRQPINPIPLIPEAKTPGYSTSIYGVEHPWGVAVSPSGDRIYASATEGERVVRIFDAGGNPLGSLRPPATTGAEHVPVYLAIDPLTSEVYVTDRPTGSIYIYDSAGVYQRQLTLAKPIEGWQPVGIAFDATGTLYVTDWSGPFPQVEVIDRQANVVRAFGETNRLTFPNGLAVDAVGNVYVADSNSGRLLVFGPGGALVAQVGRGAAEGKLGLPRGVAVDGQGRVFVGDATGQGASVFRVVQGDEGRLEYLGFFGGEGLADGQFELPNGVAVDARGRVYVADTVNDRIQVWSY